MRSPIDFLARARWMMDARSDAFISLSCRFAFVVWCALSASQVILSMKLLSEEFPFPLSLTTAKFGVATLFACIGWILRLRPVPRKWMNQLWHLLPVVLLNTLGLSLNDFSLFSGTIFLNQTTRAAQSSTTVILTNLPSNVWSMMPLVMTFGGIHHAITTSSLLETCVLTSMASNLAFSLRGIYSKRIVWQRATPANNFSIITMLSFLIMLPITYYVEGT